MNSEIGKLRGTEIEYREGTLEFDVDSLEIRVEADTNYKGSFRMLAHAKVRAEGKIYTTDHRMNCSDKGFRGTDMEVPFLYDTTGLESGDVVRGEFYIVSNLGEYHLPYEVKITGKVMDSELGEIKNLFHFANLAKVNRQEALTCFVSKEFVHILTGSGRQYLEAYGGLVENGVENRCLDYALEQFLVLIRKKQPIVFRFPEDKLQYDIEDVPDQIELVVERNGWGYTDLSVETYGNFLKTRNISLKDVDFVNDRAKILVSIDTKKINAGRNRGYIRLVGKDFEKHCEIIIEKSFENEEKKIYQFRKRQLTSVMMRLYLDYRAGTKPAKECLSIAGEILERMQGMGEVMPMMYLAHVKLLIGQENEAVWLLKQTKRLMEGIQMPLDKYGYFLYLTAMSESDDKKRAEELLDRYVTQYPDNFVLYWGHMHKEKAAEQNPGTVYRKLKEFWEQGCNNPVLYMEAAMLVLKHPEVYSVMDRFEVQLLLFMERYQLLADRIIEQIYQAAIGVKGYHPMLLQVLTEHPMKDKKKMLQVLCMQYMRGECLGRKAAETLRSGIEAECRITGIYEAYIRALNDDRGEVLPPAVVRYFAYDSSLNDASLAYVYAKVIRQQEDISDDYNKKIREFAMRQLRAGRIDSNLAYLYRNILVPEDMDELMQRNLQELCFAHVLTVEGGDWQNCIIRHEGMKGQRKYAIKNGKALVHIYSDRYTILLEDTKGNCQCPEQSFEISMLLGCERMKTLLAGLEQFAFHEAFYRFMAKPMEQIDNIQEFRSAEVQYRQLLKQNELTDEYRKELAGSLLCAYERWGMKEELDEFLNETDAGEFGSKNRAKYVHLLCEQGFYQKAFQTACTYGYEKTDDRILARLCQFMIEEIAGDKDKAVLKLAYQVFERGKYTESMLEYLVCHFEGTVKQMRKVWKAAVAMDVDATVIAERILQQILKTGAYTSDREKIFDYYCNKKESSELICTYLSMRAIAYLVQDEEVEDSIFDRLRTLLQEEWAFPLGAKLAFLQYYSTRVNELSETERMLCTELLGESLGADIYFPFYAAYAEWYPVLEVYGESRYIEFKTTPGARVMIHYIVDGPGGCGTVYSKEEMTEIYSGIYQKAFRLFWGECLQYYVTQQLGEEEQFVMSGSMERGETMDENSHGRFRMLNDIALSMELRDYNTAEALMLEYAQHDFITDKMLRIK
ncbi:MAG: hypothetical protein IJZ44_01460 [Lachnospiraceae bacterium]|nr:hypothetical protein [Lachnospiraceae bacterium]